MTTLKTLAGFATIDITPTGPVELIGCYRPDNRATGVLHPLLAQALVLSRGAENFCLIAIDSLGLTVERGDALREQVAAVLGTIPGNVMLCFSHTHSAPEPTPRALGGERYWEHLQTQTIACVRNAQSAQRPCLAGWALTRTDIGENRRAGGTALDDRLGALRITDESSAPIVTVLRVTAHANVLMTHSSQVSSDYFGPARQALSAQLGTPVMLLQGASGNIKPVLVDMIYGGTEADLAPIVDRLTASARTLAFAPEPITTLRMRSTCLDFASPVPDAAQAQSIAGASGIDASAWLDECARLRQQGITAQHQRGELQLLQIGQGAFAGVPEEIFCELAIDAAARTHNPFFFLGGYTNACTGYLPTAAEWAKGGYETHDSLLSYFPFHGHVMPFAEGTAEEIVQAAVGLWEGV